MNDFLASDKLPRSIFTNTLKDDFSFTDPLKIKDDVEPVNNYKRKLISGIKELKKALPHLSDKHNSSDLVVNKLSKFSAKTDAGNFLDRIPGVSEKTRRNLLSRDVLSSIDRAGSVDDYINIAGRVLEVPYGEMETVRSLQEVAKMLENNTLMSTLNENLKSSLVGIGLDVAGQYGYRDLAEYLIDKLDRPSQKHMAWGQAIYSYGLSSELDVVLKAIRNGGLTGIYSLTNDPVGHILGSFRFNIARHGSVSKNMDLLIEVLDLLDPEWLKYRRGDETIYNLCNLRKASQDAINGFDSIEEIRPFARSSKVLRPMDSRAIMRSTYPILASLM